MARTLQIKISLNGIEHEIWRRFVVKDSISFNYFHKIIQKIMGWKNYHMFQFTIGGKTITSSEEGHNLAEASFKTLFQSPEFLKMLEEREKSGKLEGSFDINEINHIIEQTKEDKQKEKYNLKTKIGYLLNSEGQRFIYTYDFGDKWEHTLVVEKIEDQDNSKKYPFCLAGGRACPPEDCGGIEGYYNLMEIRKNKNHPQYKASIVNWLGEEYDPERFDAKWADLTLREKENAGGWVKFVPIGGLLKKDNSKVKEIKTIFNREWEYGDYLEEIEYTVAELFLKDRSLKDRDVEQAIKNIKKNYNEDLSFFQTRLEKEIVMQLSVVLQEKSITRHELKLVLDYVLWSIDNRSWMSDKQAFVKWLPFFFDLYKHKEKKEYESYVLKISRRMGLSQANINQLLMRGEGLNQKQVEESSLESHFFSLDEYEKFDFVVAHALKNPFLLEQYSIELTEKEDYHGIEKLYLKMLEISNNHPLFECMLGLNYIQLGEKEKARKHLENAKKGFEEFQTEVDDEIKEQTLHMMEEALKELQDNMSDLNRFF